MYEHNELDEDNSYKYLKFTLNHKLIEHYTLRKGLMEGRNPILVLRIMVNNHISSYLEKNKPLFEIPIILIILYGCEFLGL